MRYPLVDGQGNFGSVDGDPPAAYRYTESRLNASPKSCWPTSTRTRSTSSRTTTGRRIEPTVLPSPFPNLLVNGSSGIAVGMATNIPPHNLTEVINGTSRSPILEGHDEDGRQQPLTRDEKRRRLVEHITGPDFPTGGILRPGRHRSPTHGTGTVLVRASRASRPLGRSSDRTIVIDEIPFQVNKAKLIERIAELVRDKTLEGIAELRDESDREGMRVVIELQARRDARHRAERALQAHAAAVLRSASSCWPSSTAGRASLPIARTRSSGSSTSGARSCAAAPTSSCEGRGAAPTSSRACGSRLDNLDAVITLIRAPRIRPRPARA